MAEELEESILRSLRKVSRAIDLHSRRLVASYQLTGPQLVCLRQIKESPGMTPTQLARAVALSNATITGILSRLESRGFVEREKSATDRRRVLLALTPAGQQLVAQAPSPLQERFARALLEVPEANRTIIDTVLKQIVEMMGAEELDAAPLFATGPILAAPETVGGLLSDDGVAAAEDPEPER